MDKRTIWLGEFSPLDGAYIDASGIPRGVSFWPYITVKGELDPEEHVLEDFGKLKRRIKGTLDRLLDHRLWILEGYSNYTIGWRVSGVDEIPSLDIDTPYFQAILPGDAIQRIRRFPSVDFTTSPEYVLKQYLTAYINGLFVQDPLDIKIELSRKFSVPPAFKDYSGNVVDFNYIHGLRDSTSLGCQNILHGHSSQICFRCNYPLVRVLHNIENISFAFHTTLQRIFKGQMFIYVWKRNVIGSPDPSPDKGVSYSYTSRDRGAFSVHTKLTFCEKVNPECSYPRIVITPSETTAENLSVAMGSICLEAFTSERNIPLHFVLTDSDIGDTDNQDALIQFYVSEGLNKGGLATFRVEKD